MHKIMQDFYELEQAYVKVPGTQDTYISVKKSCFKDYIQ